MGVKKEKPFCSGTMTKAGLMKWVMNILRNTSFKWRPYNDHLRLNRRNKTEVKTFGEDISARTTWVYKCIQCNLWFSRKSVEMDHITEVGWPKDFNDLGPCIKRLLVEIDGWQILCKSCHKQKTLAQKKKV